MATTTDFAPANDTSSQVDPATEIIRDREKTWGGFMHLVRRFLIHMACILAALYCFIFAANPLGGAFFLAAAAVVLVYGIVTIPRAASKAEAEDRLGRDNLG
jgi:hypothetical protein